MPTHPGRHDPHANHLLAALPAASLARIIPLLVPIRTDRGEVLVHADEPVERVFFPTGGLFSLLVKTIDGGAVEAAVASREGMLGTAMVLDLPVSTFEELCQIENGVLALPAPALRAEFLSQPDVHRLFLGYVGAVLTATARSVACNRVHTTRQRLARWLLEVRDRVESDRFFLTQDFLGHMLGVRRPTVSEAAGALQDEGLIRYERGRIRLLDEAGLEAAACEDYPYIRNAYAAILAN